MDKETKSKIKNLILTLREKFEKEVKIGLNKYGIYVDKEWKDGRSLRHLSKEDMNDKKRVEAFIKRQEAAGLSILEATKEFIKETSYTWINRLVGLKCMETRGLIEGEVITTREEFGGRSKRHRDYRHAHPEVAHRKDEGLVACLMEVFGEITEEIKVLFDPKNEYSLILLRYPVFREAIELINNSVGYDVYKEDEVLGWVYQYFQTKEKDRIFDEVYKKKKKISGSDIIPVTSLYTEKYMVRFLVENSLGAIWMEMYPQSNLYKNWEYFVKDPNNTTREPKQVKKITFLDPACGSGHFLLYAFDLFYQMYKEEGVVPEEDIPESILKYNLHGIDIDLRSVQLSALGLWMKAKSKNPDIQINQINLVSADAVMVDGNRLNEFLNEFGDGEGAKDLVKTIWRGLQNVRELGSLLKVEEQIDEAIERMKSQTRLGKEWENEPFTWEKWKSHIIEKLKDYYEEAAETIDINKQMFANETIKGISFIDLISQKYDVVATNPPYMGNKTMGDVIKDYIWDAYPHSKYDLYASFIERCLDFAEKNGFISMITQQSFMFNTTFTNLRRRILNENFIRAVGHLGPHAFEDISGEKVNTTLFSIKRDKENKKLSAFLRAIEVSDKSQKLRELANRLTTKDNYLVHQDDFKIIETYSFTYWMPHKIRDIFKNSEKLDNGTNNAFAFSRKGISTGYNDKYLGYIWEKLEPLKHNFKILSKGGEYNKWFGNLDIIINWNNESKIHYASSPEARSNYLASYFSKGDNKFYDTGGVTYTLNSNDFSARIFHKNIILEANGPGLFPNRIDLYYLLGFMNATLNNYFLEFLSPTIAFNISEIARIPFKEPPSKTEKTVSILSKQCVSIKKYLLQFTINDHEFKEPAILWGKEMTEGGAK